MKLWKKLAGIVLSACMAAAVIAVPNADAHAAEVKASVESKNIEISAGSVYTSSILVRYGKGDAQIKNIKSSSKNLFVRQTDQEYHSYENTYSSNPYGYARIGLYAKKNGSYKVSFDVCDINGKKTNRFTVTVKARDMVYGDSPIKKVTYAGKMDQWYALAKKNSGKFKVKMNKGYKLKSITMEYLDANGNRQEKKIKNNAKVSLGRYVYRDEYENNYDDYWYSENYSHYYMRTSLFAQTTFRIEYQNKKTKAVSETSYSLYALPLN